MTNYNPLGKVINSSVMTWDKFREGLGFVEGFEHLELADGFQYVPILKQLKYTHPLDLLYNLIVVITLEGDMYDVKLRIASDVSVGSRIGQTATKQFKRLTQQYGREGSESLGDAQREFKEFLESFLS